MRYFINDQGGWMSISGNVDAFAIVPDGFREVNEEEFNEAAGIAVIPAPPS
ncbi:hypothetical protein ACFPN0_15285 [Kitasatospora cinereorecta]